MHGFYNRILTVDMSSSSATIEKIEDEVIEEYLGVKGLATHLLLERNPVVLIRWPQRIT
jgi:aldehyde:ferredoxin oxidoreductase